MKTLFINISSPIAIRNFFLVPSGVLDLLKKQNVRIIILITKQAYKEVQKDFAGDNVIVEPVEVSWKKTYFQQVVTFFTTYLNLTDLARLAALMEVRIDIEPKGRLLYPLKVFIANTFGKVSVIRTRFAPWLESLAYRERPYRYLFEKYKPDAVFVTDILSPQGLAVLREAGRSRVTSIGMTESWDHFPKRFEPVHADILLVWNEVLRKEATELQNYNNEKIYTVGVPQYDIFTRKEFLLSRDEFFKKFNLNSKKKLIAFFSSSKRAPDDGDVVDMMLNFIKRGELVEPAQIFVRAYPGVNSDHEKFDVFNADKLVYVDWTETKKIFGNAASGWYPTKESLIHLMNILYHSDIIVSTYSSVSIEASVFLKPSLNINFDGYKQRPFKKSIKRSVYKSHYKHVFNTGGVEQIENKEQLLSALSTYLKNPGVNVENIRKLRDTMCFRIDGNASKRIVETILTHMS